MNHKGSATLGPLNHFRAATAYQIRTINIVPPYTREVQFIVKSSRSEFLTAGKQRTGITRRLHATATNPHGRENLPRFQGPERKFLRTNIIRRAIGMMNAMYWATAPIEKMAPTATGPAKISRLRRIPIKQFIQTKGRSKCKTGNYRRKREFWSMDELWTRFLSLEKHCPERGHRSRGN